MAFFKRLAHRLQNAALEFRQFVQKQNAVVRERNFSGRWIYISTEQTGIARRVMRRAERPLRHERLPWFQ